MSSKIIMRFSVIGLASILFAGCSSTPEVRELAKLTAANSSLVGSQLTSFAKNSRQIAELRAEAAASLSEEVERQQATFDTYIESARAAATIAGQTKEPNYADLVVELQRASDAIQKRQQAIQLERETVRQEILASQQDLKTPKKNLDTIAKQLGTLAEEPSIEDQLKFLANYFKEVYQDIKAAKGESEKAVTNAGSNVNKAKDAAAEPTPGA